MYLERLLPENVRHLTAVEQVFTDGPQPIRRWTLLSAGAAAMARLRCLALVSLGRRQMSRLAGQVLPLRAADPDRPVQVEFVLIRHAPQERGPHSPSRHHQGWRLLAGGRWEALAFEELRCQVSGVRQGGVESDRSQTGRLLLGYLPLLGGPLPDHRHLFDDRADVLLKELVRIVFRQNMKRMETYYR